MPASRRGDGRLSDEGRERGQLGLAGAALRELAEHARSALAIVHDGRGGDAVWSGSVRCLGVVSSVSDDTAPRERSCCTGLRR